MFVATSTPAAGVIANAETEHPSAEMVRAMLIQCASINCPLSLGALQPRTLVIERVDTGGSILATGSYAVPASGERDRALEFKVDVAVFPRASVRARFTECDPGEIQWVIINYEVTNG